MFKRKKIAQGNEQAIHAKRKPKRNQEQPLPWQMPSAGDDCRKLMFLNTFCGSVNWYTFLETVWQ